jgi:transposase
MDTFVGIDVSKMTFDVHLRRPDNQEQAFSLANARSGHCDLVKRLTRRGGRARVVLEASGHYHFRLALALHEAEGVQVMVVNPRAARNFARANMQRSKTDALDATVLLEFAQRMPFQPWTPPTKQEMELRSVARRIGSLMKTRTQEKNRHHAAEYVSDTVCRDIDVNVRHLGRRIIALQAGARRLIETCPRLRRQFSQLTSIKGIAAASAIQILGELCVLPKDMSKRQWVAMAGLDPRIFQSGLSVHPPARISRLGNRFIRAALYLPALTAIRWEPNVKAFYEKLIARKKAPLQAIVAVMRKLLHAIHGMIRTGTDFDGEKFYALG